nr:MULTISPECIES: DUF6734 family protein [unclassified Pedobacter]
MQNKELGTAYYSDMCASEFRHLTHLPTCVKNIQNLNSIPSVNAGIFGGNYLMFLKEYVDLAATFALKNISSENKTTASFNVIFEQILFSSLCDQRGLDVSCYFEKSYNDNGYQTKEFADFYLCKDKLEYLRLIGLKKKEPKVCDEMALLKKWYITYHLP